jgi:hypothetical protein
MGDDRTEAHALKAPNKALVSDPRGLRFAMWRRRRQDSATHHAREKLRGVFVMFMPHSFEAFVIEPA